MLNPNIQLPTLSPRLKAIFDRVQQAQDLHDYHHIWDCCCDHGYLGLQLLQHQTAEKIIFVDQIPDLINRLKQRLEAFPSKNYAALAADAGQLVFDSNKRHLVILAGVGGEHSIDIVSAIIDKHPAVTIDYLFCPTTTQFNLREYLAQNAFSLCAETIVSEKGRDYEVIHVNTKLAGEKVNAPVSLTGDMWAPYNSHHKRYLSKLIKHYERQTLGHNSEKPKQILARYQQRREQLDLA